MNDKNESRTVESPPNVKRQKKIRNCRKGQIPPLQGIALVENEECKYNILHDTRGYNKRFTVKTSGRHDVCHSCYCVLRILHFIINLKFDRGERTLIRRLFVPHFTLPREVKTFCSKYSGAFILRLFSVPRYNGATVYRT